MTAHPSSVGAFAALLVLFGGCTHEAVTGGDRVALPTEPRFQILIEECTDPVDAAPTPRVSSLYVFRYPSQMLTNHIVGEAEVYAKVDIDGKVSSVLPIKGNKPEFLSAAIEGISRSLFFPATKEGKPVPCNVRCVVLFDLKYADE